jgi:hypothetical protein
VRPRTGSAYFLQQIERLLSARPVGFGVDDAEKAAEKMKREACLSELMKGRWLGTHAHYDGHDFPIVFAAGFSRDSVHRYLFPFCSSRSIVKTNTRSPSCTCRSAGAQEPLILRYQREM